MFVMGVTGVLEGERRLIESKLYRLSDISIHQRRYIVISNAMPVMYGTTSNQRHGLKRR